MLMQEYSGSWVVEADPSAHTTTLLKYEISLQPKLSIPSAIVTCVVKAGLPANMMAMAKRAEEVRVSQLACVLGCSSCCFCIALHCKLLCVLLTQGAEGACSNNSKGLAYKHASAGIHLYPSSCSKFCSSRSIGAACSKGQLSLLASSMLMCIVFACHQSIYHNPLQVVLLSRVLTSALPL